MTENVNIKRGRGRPRILTDAERIKRKSKLMLEKEWFCQICNNNKNYSLAGKFCHLKTMKHQKNIKKLNP